MSTAILSSFSADFSSDFLKQATQKYPLERKLSSPIGLASFRRSAQTCSTNSSPIVLATTPGPQKVILNQNSAVQMGGREHRKLDRSISEPIESKTQQPSPNNSSKGQPANSSRYKTELCRPFEENGSCKYGEKCQFAHGPSELRALARHPKYKTELCRTFHSTGLCPYGPRCHFIHNDEKKSTPSIIAPPPPPQVQNALHQSITPALPTTRPKALSIGLGSTGDLSPPSSHSGSPTSSLNSFFLDDSLHSPTSPPFYDFSTPLPTGKQQNPVNALSFNADIGLMMDNYANSLLVPPSVLDSPTSQGEDHFPYFEGMHAIGSGYNMQNCSLLDARKMRLPIFQKLKAQ